MGREQLHEWTIQIPGDGYMESRHVYHDANGKPVESQIVVKWNDGTTVSAQVIRVLPNGDVTTEGQLRYPDDTHVSTRFHTDGRFDVVHLHPSSQETTTWKYERDGSGTVELRRQIDLGQSTGIALLTWTVMPDGSPSGDVWDLEELTDSQTGEQTQVQTRRAPDGTMTTTIKVWDHNGQLIREDTTTVHPQPAPDPGPPMSKVPTPPTPGPVTGGSPVDIITPTTRVPDGTLPGGGGWVGPGGTIVEHWKDWWIETPDGTVTFLGSELVTKKE
ncbi:hypothetical protein L1785_09175 [Antribacter sp. KLBMP9083]|uniref:Uncharacterized protein n=1 Tax=Antribacter soli TaxID=2910976 RepID=A0AA41UBJ1_9MICO|nr:hypothetical protein [Antribacter soli]MCF4121154.1 hypothetical protein [Antribacter soli]